MTARLKPHPAAELFPMLSAAEIDELAADIKVRGQLHKGVVHEGKILDGRHREEACHRAGVPFDHEQWSDVVARAADPVRAAMSPVEWVLSTNLRRRHLNETQRAVIAEEALPLLEAEARARQKATLKKGAAPVSAPGRERGAKTEAGVNRWVEEGGAHRATGESGARYMVFFYRGQYALEQQRADGSIGTTKERLESVDEAKALAAKLEREEQAKAAKAEKKKPQGKASELAAKAVGASARSVERAKAVLKKRPELREQLKAAKMTLKQAEKAIKKEEQIKNVLEYRPPVGTYAVIVADVPWQYDDQLDGSDQARGGTPYPPMPLEEILKIKPPAAPDCALWFWTTNAFLLDGSAAQVVKTWGFEAKALYTWRKVTKDGTKDRLGTGHYGQNVTEHVILAVRGKPVIDAGGQPNIFDAPRTSRHSEKPDRAFEVFEKVTPCAPEARIELFAIEERKGWVTSGSEQQAAARAARPDAREPAGAKKRKLAINYVDEAKD